MKSFLIRVGLFLLVVFGIWKATLLVADWWVLDSAHAPLPAGESAHKQIEELVVERLVPAALSEATLEAEETRSETDDQGSWTAHMLTWRLPEGEDPHRTAMRIQQLAEEMAPDSHVYVTSRDELDIDVRIYVGKRQTHHLKLLPTLSPKVPPIAGGPALVALVVTGLGEDGPGGQAVLDRSLPLTLGMLAFRPFTLRQSLQAAVKHKEILLQFSDKPNSNTEIMEAFEAVPPATGLLIDVVPQSLPVSLLLEQDLYLLDATGEVEGSVLRTASHAGVPVLRTIDHLEGEIEEDLLRLRHLARSHRGVVLTVEIGDPACKEVLDWLEKVDPREIRPAFLTEILDLP
jgi:polysaccharide deacetylase 2 family uncharacterized protein YibQ